MAFTKCNCVKKGRGQWLFNQRFSCFPYFLKNRKLILKNCQELFFIKFFQSSDKSIKVKICIAFYVFKN